MAQSVFVAVSDLLAQDRFAAALGVTLVAAELDRVVVEMIVTDRHLDETGTLSPGALFSLADCALSLISNAEATAVAIATHLTCLAAAHPGDVVRAEATPRLPRADRAATFGISLSVEGEPIADFTGSTLRIGCR